MDPTFLPATQLAALVRGGKIGALELLDHYIARTERLDTRINAVVVRDFDRARTRAKRPGLASPTNPPRCSASPPPSRKASTSRASPLPEATRN